MPLSAKEVPVKKFSMDSIALKSSAKTRMIIVFVGVLLNVAFIYFVILPLRARMETTAKANDDTILNNDQIRAFISTTKEKQQLVAELSAEHEKLVARGVITPLLNSYAMRAKTILAPCAAKNGLAFEDVKELPSIPLQQPQPLKKSAYCRQPIEFTTSGSYTQLATFISCVESEFPMAILSSLKISAQPRDPEIHLIKISFEWPVKTEITPDN